MAYEPRPGNFSIFKNQKKTKDIQPDYWGEGLDCGGNPIQVSCWLKDSKNGKFFSCLMQPKRQPDKDQASSVQPASDLDDDIPF